MLFYKKLKLGDLWYPRSITVGTYDTDDVAERLARMSTVSKGDTYAVLVGLGEVLGDMLESGSSVKLKGVGTFMLNGVSSGRGVKTPEEVNGEQFHDVRVRFIPEYSRGHDKKVKRRTVVPERVEWVEWTSER